MWDAYRRYLRDPPHRVIEWEDGETGARAWLVLNSLRGGAAGGGTRMRAGLDREEVTYLAKTMELKFAFSGPPIGGGKSGIDFDPSDPRRRDVLERWFRAIHPELASCYGTGGDMNVDEQRDVVPLCASLGLAHPQEGVVRGHLKLEGAEIAGSFRRLREGLSAPVREPGLAVAGAGLTVSDLITGYGVARSAERLACLRGGSLRGLRVVVEGFGNVGASCALYLARAGASIVGVVDAEHGLACEPGLDLRAVEELLADRRGRTLPAHPDRLEGPDRERVYEVEADVFVPAAVSGSVDPSRLDTLAGAGVHSIVCGANQPFREGFPGATETQERADRDFDVIVDAVGSLGMARSFHALMTGEVEPTDAAVFRVVRETVDRTVERVIDRGASGSGGLVAAALGIALEAR